MESDECPLFDVRHFCNERRTVEEAPRHFNEKEWREFAKVCEADSAARRVGLPASTWNWYHEEERAYYLGRKW